MPRGWPPRSCASSEGPALVVTGASLERTTWLLDDLRHENITVDVFSVADEPTVETVRAGLAVARRSRAEAVIALGGGSAIDAGKAIGALAREDGDALDYLEVVGPSARSRPHRCRSSRSRPPQVPAPR